jgi:hypothetical protein
MKDGGMKNDGEMKKTKNNNRYRQKMSWRM